MTIFISKLQTKADIRGKQKFSSLGQPFESSAEQENKNVQGCPSPGYLSKEEAGPNYSKS